MAAEAEADADELAGGSGNDSEWEEYEGDGEEDDVMDEAAAVEHAKAVAAALKSGASGARGGGGGGSGIEDQMAELNMDRYDDEDEGGASAGGRIFGGGNPGMTYYRSNKEDPYITLQESDDEASEIDDLAFKPTDLIILAARNEDDVSHLEVWVYEEADGDSEANLYVHHDIMLPAFPLAVAWLDCDPAGLRPAANMAAVGSYDTGIEIWDLDVLDSVEPAAVLGGPLAGGSIALAAAEAAAGKGKSKKKKKPKPVLKEGSHTDAVLGLAWNREFRNVLASASADKTVKVWDIATCACKHTLSHHSDKVQSVAWNAAQPSVLLSGGFDQAAFLADVRTPDGTPLKWGTDSDVESLAWVPHEPTQFLVSTEDGLVAMFDARAGGGSAPLWRLSAHDKPTCALSMCPAVPGLLATASTDKKVKLWDFSSGQPVAISNQDLKVGALFSAGFCPESPFLVAAGGAKGSVAVWDTLTDPLVAGKYGRKASRGRAVAERAVEAAERDV